MTRPAHNHTSSTRVRGRRDAGESLIEVLVTVTIISVGLLGIAALQFMSKRSNFDAVERTIATQLADDILERMRANSTALTTYAGSSDIPLTTLGYGDTQFASGEPSPNCTTTSPCTSTAQLADHDLWEFEQKLLGATEILGTNNTGGLANPIACITTAVSSGPVNRSGHYTVAIAWRGNVDMADPQNPVQPPPSPDPYSCGDDNGPMGTGPYDGSSKNSYRRILIVDTYIAQSP